MSNFCRPHGISIHKILSFPWSLFIFLIIWHQANFLSTSYKLHNLTDISWHPLQYVHTFAQNIAFVKYTLFISNFIISAWITDLMGSQKTFLIFSFSQKDQYTNTGFIGSLNKGQIQITSASLWCSLSKKSRRSIILTVCFIFLFNQQMAAFASFCPKSIWGVRNHVKLIHVVTSRRGFSKGTVLCGGY